MLRVQAGHLVRDRLIVLRFGLVGLTATAVHLGVAVAAEAMTHRPFAANLIGFLAAFGVSFAGHALWTFQVTERWRQAAVRFFAISASSFAFSTLVLAGCVGSGRLSPLASILVSVSVIPACNYLAARAWAFRVVMPSRPLDV